MFYRYCQLYDTFVVTDQLTCSIDSTTSQGSGYLFGMGIYFGRGVCAYNPVIDKCGYLHTNNPDIDNCGVIFNKFYLKLQEMSRMQ